MYKDKLNLKLPLFDMSVMTELMDVMIQHVVFGFIFDSNHNIISGLKRSTYAKDGEDGRVPQKFRDIHSRSLRWRFRLFGIVSMAVAPFYFIYQLILYIFQYGEEFRSNPTALGARYVCLRAV